MSNVFGSVLTIEELEYWMAFDIIKNAINCNIEYKWLTLDETIEEIMNFRKERMDEVERIKAKTNIK